MTNYETYKYECHCKTNGMATKPISIGIMPMCIMPGIIFWDLGTIFFMPLLNQPFILINWYCVFSNFIFSLSLSHVEGCCSVIPGGSSVCGSWSSPQTTKSLPIFSSHA